MEKLKLIFGNALKGDKTLWMAYFLLSIISLVEVYSAASTLSYRSGDFSAPFFRHLMFVGFGALTVWVVHLFPTKYLRLLPVTALPISWLALASALAFAAVVNGASRWLWATEMAKISTIVATAVILSRTQQEHTAHPKAMTFILGITGVTFLLIFPDNLSSAALIFLCILGMMIIGRISVVQLSKLLGIMCLVGGLALGICLSIPKDTLHKLDEYPATKRVSTWVGRIQEFFRDEDDEEGEAYDVHGKKAQRIYADLAMQEGGILGKGPGNSTYTDFLPQAYSDFIFSIILEEMGYVGGSFVFFLFVVIFYRSCRLALECESLFSAFLVSGLSLMLFLQACVNIAVAVGAMPITGQPLPFVSRGGWSMISSCICLGIIIGVSRKRNQVKVLVDGKKE